ncbi:MAG: hypothetical protein E7523_11905 [Ruminococcaceae bacterium]|nr:hypothetical protein [Oscillospiraceae bacterium]
MNNKNLLIGYNTFADRINEISFYGPAQSGGGADWVLCHFDPHESVHNSCKQADVTAKRFAELGVDFVSNFEFMNFAEHYTTDDGYDWCNHADGTHRLNLPPEYINTFAQHKNYIGCMHDEMEHVIINRNLSIALNNKKKRIYPMFPLYNGKDVIAQGELCSKQVKEFADSIKAMGAPAFAGEHVFPVLFHTFARNGIIPNFKSQKENFSSLMFAVAAGAALQYKMPLWNCVDLWHILTYPGHSADEMYHNLVFAYLAGVNRVYVEASNQFYKQNEDGSTEQTEYGKQFDRFTSEYRGKERKYDIQDYRPEIGIVRYDDTFWGQNDPFMWAPILFGNKNIKPNKKAKEWLRVLHVVSHKSTSKHGFGWNKISPWSLRKHRSFAPMNALAVFDDRVEKDVLESLSLCFLCGYKIEKNTLTAVDELVKENGLTVVTPARFAPAFVKKQVKFGFADVKDGKGRWIIAKKADDIRVTRRIRHLLGNNDEIRLRFSEEEIILKIAHDGNGFVVM